MPIISGGGGGGGGSGTVTSVASGDTSIVVTNATTTASLQLAALNTIATNEAATGDVTINSHKLTNVTAGTASTDAANVSQLSFVKLSDTTLSGSAANFDLTSISGAYNHLRLVCQLRDDDSAASGLSWVLMRFNNDSGNNYDIGGVIWNNGGGGIDAIAQTSITNLMIAAGSTHGSANTAGSGEFTIPNYAGTTFFKGFTGTFMCQADTSSPNGQVAGQMGGQWRNTAAITRITLLPGGGSNFLTGSRVTLYGLL